MKIKTKQLAELWSRRAEMDMKEKEQERQHELKV